MTSKELIEKVKHCGFEEWRLAIEKIEKELNALEIIKKYSFVFVEKGELKSGKYADIELLLDETDFENKEEYELLKEVFYNGL